MNWPAPSRNRPRVDLAILYPQVDTIVDTCLRAAVDKVWDELWSRSRWADPGDVPTSGEIPYSNLSHTRSVLQIALAIADAFAIHHGLTVNRDYLIAAAVLQDASKVIEYEPSELGTAVKSEIGRTFPHAFWCVHFAVLHGLPAQVCDTLLYHSPGAVRFPSTPEGKILYYADQVDLVAINGDRWKKQLFVSK
jgi:hypothetical protein